MKALCSMLLLVFACTRDAADPERVLHLASRERVPPSDARMVRPRVFVKTLRTGPGPIVGKDGGEFAGYAERFYSDDGYDTGTAIEIRSWTQLSSAEKQYLAGARGGDVRRLWDCTKVPQESRKCVVFDLTIFGSHELTKARGDA